MEVWIDGYEANVLQRLGSSQVAFKLLKSLEKIDDKNSYTILLPTPPLEDLPEERESWKYKVLKPKRFWTRIVLPLELYTSKDKPDLFFSPTHYLPRFIPAGIKKVVTIFDLSFLHFPQMFTKKDLWQLKNWTKFSAQNADCIITISQSSKNDICKEYGMAEEKVVVAYPGYDREKFKVPRPRSAKPRQRRAKRGGQSSKFKVEEIKKQYGIKDSYIIYIGTVQPRKNLVRLMEAFAKVVKDKEMELVIAGKTKGEGRQGWMYADILKTPKELGIAERVKFLGFVPSEELVVLLSGALAFIQPSLWEGFGIPVVEAMATGVPVLVSNVSSLPEVVGKAGLLFDPYSVDQIEQAIRTIIADQKLRQKYAKAGVLQSQKFSWEKMAKTVLEVLRSCSTKGVKLTHPWGG